MGRKNIKDAILQLWTRYGMGSMMKYSFISFSSICFFCQWKKLHAYAAQAGIQIIGDIPIYVALDSADAWAEPQLFQFDEELNPVAVAGCPPDAFSATGQLWGNPLYRWEYHRQTGYAWWIRRIAQCLNPCMTASVLIIFVDLTNITAFRRGMRRQNTDTGSRDRA